MQSHSSPIYSTSMYVVTSNMRSVLYIYHNGITLTLGPFLPNVVNLDMSLYRYFNLKNI